jgi:hypothetical protein
MLGLVRAKDGNTANVRRVNLHVKQGTQKTRLLRASMGAAEHSMPGQGCFALADLWKQPQW